MNNEDYWSKFFDRALDILFAKYPARTGLGIIFGSVISFFTKLFDPALKNINFADFSNAPWWGWLPVGIFIMHFPTIASLFKQNPIGNDAVDQALDLIERGNFSQNEKRQQYRLLIDRVSSNVAISKETKNEMKNIEKGMSQQAGSSKKR